MAKKKPKKSSGGMALLILVAVFLYFSHKGTDPVLGSINAANCHSHSRIAVEQCYAQHVFHNDPAQQRCLVLLWNAESGWSPYAQNSSGAYGIPQSLGHGHPYNLGDWKAQIRWGARYIHGRWGTPCGIWAIYCVNTPNHPVNSSTGKCWY